MKHFRSISIFAIVTMLAGAAASSTKTAPETLLREGRIDEATAAINQRIQNSPNDAEAYNLLARAYFAIEKWDAAIKAGEKSVTLAPDRSVYHLWLGRAYGRKAENCNVFCGASMARKMRVEFERAVELDGNDVHARTDLAEFYVEAPGVVGGGKDKARREADTIARQDAATGHWVRARLAEKEKDLTTAEREYKAAAGDSCDRPENWLSLASFYRRQSRYIEMEAAINKAAVCQKKPSNWLFDAGSLLHRAGRNLPQAVQFLANYLSAKDKTEDAPAFQAHYLLGQIYEKQGKKDDAAKEYVAALALAKDYDKARSALQKLK
jgi:cytochrome c-type biogenesis protein CcmH/NrfG